MESASGAEAQSLVGSTADAAFAVDEAGRIIAWNDAAEHLLGYPADRVIGQPCHELLAGIDVFGNLYCCEDCLPQRMIRCRQPVHGFQLDVKRASGEFVRVDLSVVTLPGAQPSQHAVMHILRPSSKAVAPNHFLEGLRAGAQRVEVSPDSIRAAEREPAQRPEQALTQREIEVLRRIAGGASPQETADGMGVSIHTIRTHLQSILHKLEVHSTPQAVFQALRRRLI